MASKASGNSARGVLVPSCFSPPLLDKDLYVRSGLVQQLCGDMTRGGELGMVVAPAGYGKSLLLAQCQSTYAEAGWRTGWLTLESRHNDYGVFCSYLQELLRRLFEDKEATDELWDGLDAAIAWIAERVESASGRFALFFDDLHEVSDPAIHELIQQLVMHLSGDLSVFIASRINPPLRVAKLNVSNRLRRLDLHDLSFSRQDTSEFFRASKQLKITDEDLTLLHETTAGWIGVMQLAAISLRGAADAQTLIGHGLGTGKSVSEFLNEEVFATLPPEVAEFLTQIAITERTCPALCSALTGEQDINTKLEAIGALGCLVQSLDHERTWFRVHPIVRDFLRQRLEAQRHEESITLHRRAARWFEEQGYIEDAIQCAINAGDETYALNLMEEHAGHLVDVGHLSQLLALVRRLPGKLLNNSLELLIQLAWVEALNANVVRSRRLLNQVKRMLKEQQCRDVVQWARAAELEACLFLYDEDYSGGVRLVREWREKVPANAERVLASLLQLDAYSKLSTFDFEGALNNARRVIDGEFGAGAELTRSYAGCIQSLSYYYRALLKQGQFALESFLQSLTDRLDETSQAMGMVEAMLGANHYQRGELDSAEYFLGVRHKTTHREMVPAEHLLVLVPVRARLLVRMGNVDQAIDYLLETLTTADERDWIRLEASILNELVRIYLATGANDQAQMLYQDIIKKRDRYPHQSSPQFLQTNSCCEIARARILSADNKAKQAVAIVQRQRLDAMSQGRRLRYLEMSILLAKIHTDNSAAEAARAALIEALRADRENSCIQVFRDEGEHVLGELALLLDTLKETPGRVGQVSWVKQLTKVLEQATADAPQPAGPRPAKSMIENLTPREMQIMQCVVAGHSNKEIAEQLDVSTNTVKTHLQACYSKLGVARRTQAVLKAKEFGLTA